MKKSVLLLLIAVATAAVVYSLYQRDTPEWTTASNEALEEFELGREAVMRLYHEEAQDHFNRAMELDPDFAAAKLMAYRLSEHDQRQELIEDIKQIDLASLSGNEQFLIEYELAMADGKPEVAHGLLEDFATANPTNPWALEKRAELAWRLFKYEEAEKYYAKLLEVEPNWVTAENNLGYIDISRGDFQAAEEHFRTYQYIAPDQANPHDSRGELLMLTGDYQGAWDEFQAALDIRPDFCASYRHQVTAAAFGDLDRRLPEIVERARAHCPESFVEVMACQVQLMTDYRQGNDEPWFVERNDECLDKVKGNLFFHRMAVRQGKAELVQECEETVSKRGYELEEMGAEHRNPSAGYALHLEGSRLLVEDQPLKAAERLRAADSHLFYMGDDLGILKQINLVELAIALELAGESAEAQARLEEVTSVNPKMQGVHERRKSELAFLFESA